MVKLEKQGIIKFIKCIIFLAIMWWTFIFFSYLFRNEEAVSRSILGFYEEKENTIDVVFIGSSNIDRYWNPMEAWKQEGIASVNYSCPSMNIATYLNSIKEVVKTQNPEVIVISARGFSVDKYTSGVTASEIVRYFSTLDFNWARIEAISYYCKMANITWKDSLSLYINLIQFHDNYYALINQNNWRLLDNRVEDIPMDTYHGYVISEGHTCYEDVSGNISDEYAELDETALEIYIDIIEYCQENNIQLLFLMSPKIISREESMRTNALAQVAERYGVNFLDTNRLYSEMGIDFSKDFSDSQHTNIYGADKFTSYVSAYLVKNYDLTDHRGEEAYASWDELYEEYSVIVDEKRAKLAQTISENE